MDKILIQMGDGHYEAPAARIEITDTDFEKLLIPGLLVRLVVVQLPEEVKTGDEKVEAGDEEVKAGDKGVALPEPVNGVIDLEPGEPLAQNWLIVIDGRYLFGETNQDSVLTALELGARAASGGLEVRIVPDSREIRPLLIPWLERPGAAPKMARIPPGVVVAGENKRTTSQKPGPVKRAAVPTKKPPRAKIGVAQYTGVNVQKSPEGGWFATSPEIPEGEWRGSTQAEARLKAEAALAALGVNRG